MNTYKHLWRVFSHYVTVMTCEYLLFSLAWNLRVVNHTCWEQFICQFLYIINVSGGLKQENNFSFDVLMITVLWYHKLLLFISYSYVYWKSPFCMTFILSEFVSIWPSSSWNLCQFDLHPCVICVSLTFFTGTPRCTMTLYIETAWKLFAVSLTWRFHDRKGELQRVLMKLKKWRSYFAGRPE